MAEKESELADLVVRRCVCIVITGGALDIKKDCPVHGLLAPRGAEGY